MDNVTGYIQIFDRNILRFIQKTLRITGFRPTMIFSIMNVLSSQRKAIKLREMNQKSGLQVPPMLIMSITSKCNLKCAGCYAVEQNFACKAPMSSKELDTILIDAAALGVSIIFIAGGEPLIDKDLLPLLSKHKKLLFLVFTNGLLIGDTESAILKENKNIIPIISIEGYKAQTDARRGDGVYDRIQQIIHKLHCSQLFFGVSITTTTENLELVTSNEFVNEHIKLGVKAFFYIEYVPIKKDTEYLALCPEQKMKLSSKCELLDRSNPALCIAFPGDESVYGGCLAAGRGFIHIGVDGSFEPCPFAPFSETNIKNIGLREALQSPFMKLLRENHDKLSESNGGCTLWSNREWVEKMLHEAKEH